MKNTLLQKFRSAFGSEPTVIARAPGRIEFIGNHTDYNGGTVLGAAIDRGIWVAARPVAGNKAVFASGHTTSVVEVQLDASLAKQTGDRAWVNYQLGVWAKLPDFGLKQPAGFQFADVSDLPLGAGLSSSAAIELATGLALTALTGDKPERVTLVKLGRKAENEFVGVPCGILDQGVSGFGQRDHLVFIDCRGPAFSTVPLPADAHFWVFNTHTKHALVDGLYAARHRECMDAAKALGVKLLVDATPAQLEAAKASMPEANYKRAKHVIEEIGRVAAVQAALQKGDLAAVGRLLTASHRSSQNLFENSTPELDFLVDQLTTAKHVHGARLTGGGFGGAVMAMTGGAFSATDAEQIVAAYAAKFGAKPDVLHLKTGPGAELVAG
ncbi:MAG TPA: galactokinase [Opitutaceae bacterium]|nr:galactokinase [Opitutaceae bacterium]